MIYRNLEVFNVGEIIENETGSFSWLRVPQNVYDNLDGEQGKAMCKNSTGVELRFVMEGDGVTFRMRSVGTEGSFHVYRGSIQGGWEDHEVNKNVGEEFTDFVIKQSDRPHILDQISKEFDMPFSPYVIRIIFDKGCFEIADIIGDIRPASREMLPEKTYLAYGSSITHGSNGIDASHFWVSQVAHNLKMDCRNLGMAGSCLMEPEMVDYIASEGEKGRWDVATLELGINALGWDEEKIVERVSNTLMQVAGRNPDKPIFVISPFYNMDDYEKTGDSIKWRRLIEQEVEKANYKNVTYISGIDLLGDMSLISADYVHPNIYGIRGIDEKLTKIIKGKINV